MIFSREQTLARLRQRIEAGVPIIGGGAGTGISAKFEEAGGIDLIVIYSQLNAAQIQLRRFLVHCFTGRAL